MVQICAKCGTEKPIEAFPVRRDRAGGRGIVCLECGRSYSRSHYAKNRAYYIEKAARRNRAQDAKILALLVAYLRTHPCVDCGEADITVLQFDHIDPRAKDEEICLMMRRRLAWPRILAEIEKCEVRCGNCHRIRTASQRKRGEIREDVAVYESG